MDELNEISSLEVIDKVLSKLEDQAAKDRILQFVLSKHSPTLNQNLNLGGSIKSTKKHKKSRKKTKKVTKHKITFVKELNLKPKGTKSFFDFAKEKKPSNYQEKCTVSVYFLVKELGVDNISPNHIYTCFKNIMWRTPNDLYNTLLKTAQAKGWIDTSDSNNIKITPMGENFVEHDLPKKKEKSK